MCTFTALEVIAHGTRSFLSAVCQHDPVSALVSEQDETGATTCAEIAAFAVNPTVDSESLGDYRIAESNFS